MAWYWWVLIGLGVMVLGYVKFQFFRKMLKKWDDEEASEE